MSSTLGDLIEELDEDRGKAGHRLANYTKANVSLSTTVSLHYDNDEIILTDLVGNGQLDGEAKDRVLNHAKPSWLAGEWEIERKWRQRRRQCRRVELQRIVERITIMLGRIESRHAQQDVGGREREQ
jgi:hypothetical protein